LILVSNKDKFYFQYAEIDLFLDKGSKGRLQLQTVRRTGAKRTPIERGADFSSAWPQIKIKTVDTLY